VSTSETTTRRPRRLATLQDVKASGPHNANTRPKSASNPRHVCNRKHVLLLVDNLHAAHVRAHDGDGRVEDPFVERVDVAFAYQLGAGIVQSLSGLYLAGEFIKRVDGTVDLAVRAGQRDDGDVHDHPRAVRAFDDDAGVADRFTRPEHIAHRALVMRQHRAVRTDHAQRPAESLIGGGLAPPELGRAPVEGDDPRVAVAHVHGDRYRVDHGIIELCEGRDAGWN
jgi:hypothetical protein